MVEGLSKFNSQPGRKTYPEIISGEPAEQLTFFVAFEQAVRMCYAGGAEILQTAIYLHKGKAGHSDVQPCNRCTMS